MILLFMGAYFVKKTIFFNYRIQYSSSEENKSHGY